MLTVVHDADSSNEDAGSSRSLLDEIVRDGARQMLAAALRAEVAAYIEAHAGELDENGHRLVVRNGYHREREVLTAAGAVSVTAPRVNDKRVDPDTGERQRFSSAILPAWVRKSPQMTEVLPLLYLHGLSTSDFGPALEQFLGSGAGLSATTITRLTTQWQDEAKAFEARDLSGTDYVYLWVDGIHLKVRLDQEKLCLLVMLGVPVENIWVTDIEGVVFEGRTKLMDPIKARYSKVTDARTLGEVIEGADVFLGLSAGGVLKPEMVAKMAARPLIMALANPTPEITPELVKSVEVTKQGFRDIGEMHAIRRTDLRGRDYYWMAFRGAPQEHAEGTDLRAMDEGRISVTPLHIDLTHATVLHDLKGAIGGENKENKDNATQAPPNKENKV